MPATTNSPLHDAAKPEPPPPGTKPDLPPPGAKPDPPPAPRRSAVAPASSSSADLGDVELSEREPTLRLSALHERSSESFEHESPLFGGSSLEQNATPKGADEEGAPEFKPGAPVPASAAVSEASLSPDTRSVTLGGDDSPMDKEEGSA